jgi:hypothetical protein
MRSLRVIVPLLAVAIGCTGSHAPADTGPEPDRIRDLCEGWLALAEPCACVASGACTAEADAAFAHDAFSIYGSCTDACEGAFVCGDSIVRDCACNAACFRAAGPEFHALALAYFECVAAIPGCE